MNRSDAMVLLKDINMLQSTYAQHIDYLLKLIRKAGIRIPC